MNYRLIDENQDKDILKTIFINRGFTSSDIQHYINPVEQDNLDPNLLLNITDGIKMLLTHITNNDKTFLQVDCDCDGFTSAALFINYLYSLFPFYVTNCIQYRIHSGKQHGLILDTIPEDIKFVIAIDSSSNEYYEHQVLKDKGIDVLVIDHHEVDCAIDNACIINNQLNNYPNKNLSGVGVAYKFCRQIDKLLNKTNSDQFYDLTCLGICGDMMELNNFENRYIMKKGLENIRNPYFREMISIQNYSISKGGGLNPFTLSFYIVPMINATIRSGTQEEKLILFESMLDFKAYEGIPSTKRGCKGQTETRVEQACRNCKNIKNRQTKAKDASLEIIERAIQENNLLSHKILIVCLEENIEANLTGLIANELANKYFHPTLILNKRLSEDGLITWEGSGRNYTNSQLENFREFLNNTGLILYAQGHGEAFGFGIEDNKLNNFIQTTDEQLNDFDFSPCYRVDTIWDDRNFNPNDIIKIAELKDLWGKGIEEPLIAIERINVHKGSISLLSPDKNPTLKIMLPNGTELIKFGSSNEEYEQLNSELGCVTINVVGKCERNIWNGNIYPQILIQAYEVVGQTKYYF